MLLLQREGEKKKKTIQVELIFKKMNFSLLKFYAKDFFF